MGANSNNGLNGAGVSTQGFINESLHTIQGGGRIICYLVNNGKIIINNGTMSFSARLPAPVRWT